MINRIDPKNPRVSREVLNRWVQVAKQKKALTVLYKMDNVLKNTGGFKEGLIDFIAGYHLGWNATKISRNIDTWKERFVNKSLKETIVTDYWGYKRKKTIYD